MMFTFVLLVGDSLNIAFWGVKVNLPTPPLVILRVQVLLQHWYFISIALLAIDVVLSVNNLIEDVTMFGISFM